MRALPVMATMLVLLCAERAEAGSTIYPQWQEQFRDGACLIKRRQGRDGAYREEIRCDPQTAGIVAPTYNEEFQQGNCKVVRWQEANGASFFSRDCQDPG